MAETISAGTPFHINVPLGAGRLGLNIEKGPGPAHCGFDLRDIAFSPER
jgi:hypothetical protein